MYRFRPCQAIPFNRPLRPRLERGHGLCRLNSAEWEEGEELGSAQSIMIIWKRCNTVIDDSVASRYFDYCIEKNLFSFFLVVLNTIKIKKGRIKVQSFKRRILIFDYEYIFIVKTAGIYIGKFFFIFWKSMKQK